MCTNKTYSKFRLGEYLSHTLLIQNGMQQHALSTPLFNLALGNIIIDDKIIWEF